MYTWSVSLREDEEMYALQVFTLYGKYGTIALVQYGFRDS